MSMSRKLKFNDKGTGYDINAVKPCCEAFLAPLLDRHRAAALISSTVGSRTAVGPLRQPQWFALSLPAKVPLVKTSFQHIKLPGESVLVSRGSEGLRSPLESRRGSLGAP